MTRRGWVVVAAALTVLATTAGTSAFSAATGDRGVQVTVVDDDHAYLGVNVTGVTTGNTTNATITITNQFPSATTLSTINATVDDETTSLTPTDGSLDPGDATSRTIQNATCNEPVTIHASGDDVTVTLERDIDCT